MTPTLLQRLTTVYIPTEDRIRISAEDNKGRVVVLWLTQRLLKRLVPALVEWHEERMGNSIGADVRQSFAQISAVSCLAPQPPVDSEASIDAGAIESIDIKRGVDGVRLVFKTCRFEPAEVALGELMLRQWLDIVYRICVMAEWTSIPWPSWLQESCCAGQSEGKRVLH